MAFKWYLIKALFCFLIVQTMLGQNNKSNYEALKFKQISLKEGLSQSSVLSVMQDSQGFMWFGTRDGLNKFDGNTFKIFRYTSKDSTSLNHNHVKTIYQDTFNNLWVGTLKGLNKFIPESQSFKRYVLHDNKEEDKSLIIWSIIGGEEGVLWLGTDSGLKKFDIQKEALVEFDYKEEYSELFNTPVKSLVLAKNNNLWIRTTYDLAVYNLSTKAVKSYLLPEHIVPERNESGVTTLFEDMKGDIWLGFHNGLAILNKEQGVFEYFKTKNKTKACVKDDTRSICEDHLGNLWVGTYNGLYIINNARNSISHFVHDENNSNSLGQNSIYKIFRDTKGDIWIGTYSGGISYYDRSFDVFKHFNSGTNNSKLNYKVVSSFIEDSNQNLWIGTEGGGINFYNKENGTFKYYTSDSDNNTLSNNNVKAMVQDHSGNLWVGTHDGGLNFVNLNKIPFQFIRYKNIPNNINSISNDRVISLCVDDNDKVWIGTSGGGVNLFDKNTKSITRLKGLGTHIYTISKARDGHFLFIGGSNGLAKINVDTKEFVSINYIGNNESKGSNNVLCVYEDDDKNILVGTEGDGLYYYNQETNQSIKYDSSNGLPNDIIYGIVPDHNNNIWLSTNNGLSRVDLQTFQIKNFNGADGLQGNEFNYGAYLMSKNGELLFGGVNGFNVFNPNDIVENAFVPPVTITALKVNNKPFLNVTDTNTSAEIHLKHDQNMLSFDFVGLSFSQPNENEYAYMLEGFDTEWNYVGNQKSATYTNLNSGHYIFKAKASNSDGLWNEKGASIPIRVRPAPWKTWWAYLIYILLLTATALVVRKYSLIRIKERNELKNERLEKERIEEVNKLKLQLFTNVSHDFRTPLSLIIGPLQQLLKEKTGNEFVKRQHEIMYRNASSLMELINQLLDFRKSESGNLKLSVSKNNIVSFIDDIQKAFEELAKAKNITFTFKPDIEDTQVWFDPIGFKKVIVNLLSNAFKFTPENGEISLRLSLREKSTKEIPNKYVKFEVQDSGKGITSLNKKIIFERFYHSGERSGTGIGLALTKNIVELHGGEIKVKSKENKGARFIVYLPFGNNHFSEDQINNEVLDTNENDFFKLRESVYVEKELEALKEESEIHEDIIDKSRPSILIVEDNAELRSFIKNIFINTYNVFESPNGEKALEVARTESIDLIISDVMMPKMDGLELCDKLKTNIETSHIPVILLTAKTSKEFQNTGYENGADAYITKPFDANVLEVRVINLLKSRKNLIDKFRKDIILQPKELTVVSADEVFLKKAISLVEENISDSEFNVAEFTDHMHMSRSVLFRKIKALTGQSITLFIRTVKLKRAGQLLLQSQMNISEVAYEVGFNDLKYFRKCFKEHFGITPSDYRSKNVKA
ncbi:two-component regulator propeller domain-containing protein [Tamlana sp. 2201CG12-4]|uniref:hybrid sensor histidine kinase/response regulator transcription factor n=1 Tax=Tamlana sp. 2201CG12-4 TaxID=3112582 RepID=UPI002DB8B57C|nr:two-component regulator propeller domain-containing protein [Tamlana sp. 2201CG12-4]MEC3907163.1 two-component regulator propeller domain-containing protein [Tamlana sp. 2201CG12-4]